jgi:hypothetical protein
MFLCTDSFISRKKIQRELNMKQNNLGASMVLFRRLVLAGLLMAALVGCAAHYTPETISDPYGFLGGLWHGAIATLTITVNIMSWLLSLVGIEFLRDIQIIGRPNSGFIYYLGFIIGFFWLSIFR